MELTNLGLETWVEDDGTTTVMAGRGIEYTLPMDEEDAMDLAIDCIYHAELDDPDNRLGDAIVSALADRTQFSLVRVEQMIERKSNMKKAILSPQSGYILAVADTVSEAIEKLRSVTDDDCSGFPVLEITDEAANLVAENGGDTPGISIQGDGTIDVEEE